MAADTSTYILIQTCVWLALFLPLLSFIISIAIPKGYSWIVTFSAPLLTLASVVFAFVVFFSLLHNTSDFVISFSWFNVGRYHFQVGIALGHISIIMLLVVTIISFLVHLYSTGYMAGDKDITRYFAMLGFFTFSMLGIVLSDNLLLIFIFWELVGFSSYMLIGHWTEKTQAGMAAKKAFIVNRIGDVGFLIGILIILTNTGSLTLANILNPSQFYSWQTTASLCLFCGVIGKSAQFPLLTWLPDAMEGPTPVSALIHAATMVAAGIYLLSRLFFLFTPIALDVVVIVGCVTSLMASLSALVQMDMKKILAYSTISQLGFMVIAIGTNAPEAAMTHLFTHAFFKAGLFLAAGAVIHSLHQVEQQTHRHFDVQDIRNLGGLRKHLPVTFIAFVLCGAALGGLPLSSGFLSKEAILTSVWDWKGSEFSWRWIVAFVTFTIPFITVLYTFRMIWFIFFGENRTKEIVGKPIQLSEVPTVMRFPLILLSIGSLWLMVSFNPINYSGWIYNSLHSGNVSHSFAMTLFSILWILTAVFFAFFFFRNKVLVAHPTSINQLLVKSFYLDNFYNATIITPIQKISALTEKIDIKWIDGVIHAGVYAQVTLAHFIKGFDKFILDGVVNGIAQLAGGIGRFTKSFQGGKIQLYIFWSVLGIIIFLISILD